MVSRYAARNATTSTGAASLKLDSDPLGSLISSWGCDTIRVALLGDVDQPALCGDEQSSGSTHAASGRTTGFLQPELAGA